MAFFAFLTKPYHGGQAFTIKAELFEKARFRLWSYWIFSDPLSRRRPVFKGLSSQGTRSLSGRFSKVQRGSHSQDRILISQRWACLLCGQDLGPKASW